MKKIIYSVLISIFALLSVNNLYATHYAGAELNYRNLGGSNYEITLTFYRDCSGVPAPMTTNINFKCSSNPIFNFTANFNRYGNGVEVVNNCSQMPSSCDSGSYYGIQKYTYMDTVTMPPCGEWTMYWSGNARNVLSNVSGGSYNNWFIQAKLDNYGILNSNPTFNNNMVPIAFINRLTVLDYGGIDPDGDSLSYSFYSPYTGGPDNLSSIVYDSPHSYSNFLSSSTPISIDPITGIVSFTPTQLESTAFGIKVEQWRNINGNMTVVGESYRDFTISILTSSNTPPILSGIDTTNSHIYSPNDTMYTINKCFDGNPLEFYINGYDADVFNASFTGSPELFSIDWNQGINGATLTSFDNGTDHAYAKFSWLPNDSNIAMLNTFYASVTDLACPFNGTASNLYGINIIDNNVYIGNDTTLCYGESLHIQSESNVTITNYAWSLDGVSLNTIPTNDFVDLQVSDLSPGVHTLKLEIVGGNTACSNSQEITITVVELPAFNLGNDTTITDNETLTLSLPTGYPQYLWSNGSTNNTLIVDNSYNWANTITGTVFDDNGCGISDIIVVLIGNVGIISPNNSELKVYPNPIDDEINIKLKEVNSSVKLELFDANGKLVRSSEFSTKEYTLKGLSKLARGNYFINLNIDGELIEYSIIKN